MISKQNEALNASFHFLYVDIREPEELRIFDLRSPIENHVLSKKQVGAIDPNRHGGFGEPPLPVTRRKRRHQKSAPQVSADFW